MGAAVAGIDVPLVHQNGHAAEAGDGIHQQEGAGLVDDGAELVQRLGGAGGGLGMDDADHLEGALVDQGLPHGVSLKDLAPGRL